MKPALPRLVCWLIRLAAPSPGADEILADLADDYDGGRARRSRWWLTRETTSIVWAYAVKPATRAIDLAPLWVRDLQLTFREVRRGPAALLATSGTLATGLLAVLLTLGLAHTLLGRQVSTVHGDALRRIGSLDQRDRPSFRLSFAEVETIRQHLRDFADVTSVNMQPAVLRVRGADLQTLVEVVDGQYFSLIGTRARAGRSLLGTDDRANAPPAIVVTQTFADLHLGGVQRAVGASIDLNGHAFTVVGIAQAIGSSSFLGASVDGWIANAHADAVLNRDWRTNVENRWFSVFARPTSVDSWDQTRPAMEARLGAASTVLAQRYPEYWRLRRLQASPATVLTGTPRDSATLLVSVLAGLAILILVTAAANVAGVLLSRAAVRQRQIAIHLSIGSGRAAMVRRQLIEGAFLGIVSGVVAIGLYAWARKSLAEITLLPTLTLRLELPLDSRLLLVILGLGTTAGIALALGPALWTTRIEVFDSLKDGMRTSGDRRSGRLRRVLVSAQICLSLILTVGAVLFARSLSALNEVDLGFPRERLLAMDFDLEPSAPPSEQLPILARQALSRTQETPGVAFAAMSNRAPVDQSTPSTQVRGSWAIDAVIPDVTFYLATDHYFETVGVPIIAGRPFTSSEAESGAPVVIVIETLARRLASDHDVLDRSIYLNDETTPLRIVGVAKESKYRSLSESSRPHLYRPTPPALGLTLLFRTNSDPRAALRAVQHTLDGVGPGLVGFFPRTLDDHLAIELLPTRAAVAAASTLGTVALGLSAVGLYGLVSWFVTVRRREIGVRVALGASPQDVLRLVGREAVSTALPGLLFGLLACGALATLARGALFGVGPLDRLALLSGLVTIAAIVGLASYVPVRRALRVDPSAALRGR